MILSINMWNGSEKLRIVFETEDILNHIELIPVLVLLTLGIERR